MPYPHGFCEHFQGWLLFHHSEQSVQCLTALSMKKVFLISKLNVLWCSLRSFSLVLSLVTKEKNFMSFFNLSGVWYVLKQLCLKTLLSRCGLISSFCFFVFFSCFFCCDSPNTEWFSSTDFISIVPVDSVLVGWSNLRLWCECKQEYLTKHF